MSRPESVLTCHDSDQRRRRTQSHSSQWETRSRDPLRSSFPNRMIIPTPDHWPPPARRNKEIRGLVSPPGPATTLTSVWPFVENRPTLALRTLAQLADHALDADAPPLCYVQFVDVDEPRNHRVFQCFACGRIHTGIVRTSDVCSYKSGSRYRYICPSPGHVELCSAHALACGA